MVNLSNTNGQEPKQERLEIYTLGQFQVYFGGQELFARAGQSSKTSELFMYFITHRWKSAAPEIILESLWPEREYANPKNALKLLVHRLKQKLKSQQIPGASNAIRCVDGCYGWNNTLSCWLNSEAFENLCREARFLAETDPLKAIAKYREALSLYQGDYLSHLHDSGWILPVRQYYRRLFIKSLFALLALQKAQRLFSQMIEDCERVLFIEYPDENLHLLYIEALLEEGQTAQARMHYEHITSLLYRELGVKPSPALCRIYRRIKRKHEKTELEFNDVRGMLKEREQAEGPMRCEPETFYFVCSLEQRRAEREDRPVQLGLLSVTGPGFRLQPPATLEEVMAILQKVLLTQLRKGDVIASFGKNQIALLMLNLNLEQTQNVISRVKRKFEEASPEEKLVIHSSIHPVMPWI